MARVGTFGGFAFDPEVFTGYVSERDPINSLLISSGIVTSAPATVSGQIVGKNNVVTIPFYVPFSGRSKNYDGKTDNTPTTLSGKKLTAMSYRRMNAWIEDDFTHELTGANDLQNIASEVGSYQAKENQFTLLSILKGLEGVTAFASHVNDVTVIDALVDAVKANTLTPTLASVAMQKALGDHMSEVKVWFMHSAVFLDISLQGFANDVTIKAGAQNVSPFTKYFLDMPVIIDDTMTSELNATTGLMEYHTYLCGTGLFMTCPVRIDVPNYVDYNALINGGQKTLFTKWGRLMHPYGFSITADNIVEESPTDAEFETSANWTMKYDTKNIALVAFITNVLV